jgi:NADPH-dependent 2,4-dienoyl-CoA reductase/sulfur reductase-like enzyme
MYPRADIPILTCSGSGAIATVEALREGGFSGAITIISSEAYPPIDRTRLSKGLVPEAAKLALRDGDWFKSASIDMVNDTVSSVNFASKTVSTMSGKSHAYTKLILASGGTPRRLPLPGFKDLHNIFVLRTVPDVVAILEAVGAKNKNIVIVGSSFIGMEVANALAKENTVSVIGMEKAPLERVVGIEVGNVFRRNLEKNNVTFYMEASVSHASASTTTPTVVGAVHLKDGTTLPADLVILGVGVAPATEYLRDNASVALERDGSLKTDSHFAVVGHPGVYAIGDIATYPYTGPGGNGAPTRIEHWNVAQNAGRTAAAHILKPEAPPKPFIPIFWSALGGQLRYCGNTVHGWDDLAIQGDLNEGKFAAFYGENGAIVAAATMGMDPVLMKTAELMRLGIMPSVEDVKKGVNVLEHSV